MKLLKIFSFLLFCLSQLDTSAQKLDMEKLKGLKPRAIGPAGMSGRVTAIDVVKGNKKVIYIGTASGGVWKSESGGISWKPIFDEEETASIGALKIQKDNPDVIWVGTGEGNPRNSHNSGYGIYKSIDAGKTWQHLGLENTRNIHRIIIHPSNPDLAYVAAIGSAWGEHEERGVFKTTDGGKTWKKILYINTKTGAADMVLDPQNPNKLLVSMWEHQRKPWTFNSSGESSALYMSYDGGKNWKKIGKKEGLPQEVGRIGLAIAKNKPNIVYAIVEAKKNGFYKSTDGGESWKKVTDKGSFGNRPFYYSEIYVDPQNENRIYSLWSYVSKSEDGGRTWKVIADYGNKVHPDHHAFWIDEDNPNFLIDGNDGGLNFSYDGGKTWRFVENLPLAQYYHINVDNAFPYNVYGGMQDNGSWVGPAYVWKYGGIRNSYWDEIFFGDGFDVLPDQSDPNYAYAMWQGGNLGRIHIKSGSSKLIRPIHPQDTLLRFNWNAAIAQNPFDKKSIYFGSQFLHKSTDRGNTWEIISPDLTTNDTNKQDQKNSGGLTYDVTGAENFTTITAIAPSPISENVVWVGTDDGNLQITQDEGKSWTNIIKNIKGVPSGTWIAQIQASKFREGEAFVVFDNHRRHDFKPYLFHTKDFGKTWKRLADENKVFSYALCMVQDLEEEKLLFLGTDTGLFISMDAGMTWTKWTNDYPTVPTRDMVIHPREHDLVIGTFGRATYILDDIRPLRQMAKQGLNKILDKKLYVFEPPQAVLANVKQASGMRFSAQATFYGKNRPFGAMLTYYVKEAKEKKKKDKDKSEEDTTKTQTKTPKEKIQTIKDTMQVHIEILNKSEILRTIKVTPKVGINRTYWDLNRKGVVGLGSKKPKKDAKDPTGASVLPGTYTVRVIYDKDTASTKVRVIADPRVKISLSDMQAKNALVERVYKNIEATNKVVWQLEEAKETVETILKNIDKEREDKQTKALKKEAEEVKKRIAEIRKNIFGKEKVEGYYNDPAELDSKINFSNFYIQNDWEKPTQAQTLSVEHAERQNKALLKEANQFFKEDWTNFQKTVESYKFSLFGEYKPVEID